MSLNSISYGQSQAKKILESFLKREKIPATLIFAGAQGSGKSFFARHFAQDLACPSKNGIFSCLKCTSCKLIEVGTSPDFLRFSGDKSGTIKIEDMQNLREFVKFKPAYGVKKIALIEDAHLLTIEASNSMLKTLEEPNISTVIILTTSKIDFIPKTIKSRAVIIPFLPYTEEELISILLSKQINLETSQFLAKISNGNIKNALDLTKGNFIDERKTLINHLFDFLNEEPKSISITDKNKALRLITHWQLILKDALITRFVRSGEGITNLDFKKDIISFASQLDLTDLLKIEKMLIITEEELTRINVNVKNYMNSLFYSLKEIILSKIALPEEY